MRLVGCIRVSRVGGRAGESFISPDVQREQIAAYARAMGHEIIGWQDDLDQPGSTLNRPGLQAALASVKAGEADGIIAAKLDRFTRSIADLGHLLRSARDDNWNLVAVDVGLDLGTPNGRLVAHVLGAVAEWELERRRADWQEARSRAVARGVHVASRTPTGYRKRDDSVLELDPDAAPVIREAFERRAQGGGWQTTAAWLSQQGILTPYGNSTWTAGSLRKVIHNRVYLGEARSGSYVHPDAHEAIVPLALWEAAQRPGMTPLTRTDNPELLSGLVRCASCRYIARACGMNDRGQRLGLYSCRKTYAGGVCPKPVSVLSRVLDPYIEEQLLAWYRRQAIHVDVSITSDELDSARAERQAAQAEVIAYLESETLAITGQTAFAHGLTIRQEVVNAAQDREYAARAKVPHVGALTPLQIIEGWPTLTVAEKRELIAATIDCVVIYPHRSGGPLADRVLIVHRGDAPTNLPQRGRRVPLEPWPGGERELGMAATEDP